MRTKCLLALSACATALAAHQSQGPIEAERSFDAGSAKIELLGVCKASETEASCWGPDGKSSVPEIEAQFKAGFAGGDYRYLPLRFGQKTRAAIFRITNPPYGDDRVSIDSYFQSNVNTGFDLPQRSNSQLPGDSRVDIRVQVIMAGLNETTGRATTTLHRNQLPSDRMPLKEGAALDYLGQTYKVIKIVKSTLDPLIYGQEGSGRWVIAMTAAPSAAPHPTVSWIALDKSGLSIRQVDKAGNPVIVDPALINQQRYPNPNGPPQSTPNVFPASIGQSQYDVRTGDDVLLYTNIDPDKISSIYAYGSSSQKLTITGIPLERMR